MSEQDQDVANTTIKIRAFFIGLVLFFKELLDYTIKLVVTVIAALVVLIAVGFLYQINDGRVNIDISTEKTIHVLP